jgi:hypothetical protein
MEAEKASINGQITNQVRPACDSYENHFPSKHITLLYLTLFDYLRLEVLTSVSRNLLLPFSVHNLKIETAGSSETLICIYQPALCNIRGHNNLEKRRQVTSRALLSCWFPAWLILGL